MVQIPASPETETLLIELPKTIGLYVTQKQFAALDRTIGETSYNRAIMSARDSDRDPVKKALIQDGWAIAQLGKQGYFDALKPLAEVKESHQVA